MKIYLPFLGKTREKYLAAGIDDFANRLKHFVQFDCPVLKDKKKSAKDSPERLKDEEARLLLQNISSAATIVALDPSGSQLSSDGFAELISKWENQGVKEVAFLIGGPLGLADEIIRKADLVLSLSQMTFTHEMARMLVFEQLYRAYTIKAGTGYHK
ncbi:MAG: 23S rRNA (pseudouridine(1915)-N(3))-methyltransferase RlmH [Desulfobulbaceae bacterium]|nr:23S rRNA (pseudouridine(1915)-N(3))-methyltransferase RlmH [Desulfobulbaceae bacterium]HIJ77837.1 23S rRNA (pseudouridine(1915)-N(3))-methyltransferase RlmH [Deltaproteobacteria bacterium]